MARKPQGAKILHSAVLSQDDLTYSQRSVPRTCNSSFESLVLLKAVRQCSYFTSIYRLPSNSTPKNPAIPRDLDLRFLQAYEILESTLGTYRDSGMKARID